MKQGGPHSLPLDQWDFQGQMGFSGQMPARKQALGWGRKTWEPATAEGRRHVLAPGSDGAWIRLKGARQRRGKPWLNRTLHHDPSQPTIPVPRGV